VDLGEVGWRSPGALRCRQVKANGNEIGRDRQAQADEDDQEQEQDGGQRDVGPLKLAGRAILLVIEDGIGVKKIDEGDEGEKIEQEDEKKLPRAGYLHDPRL
jgi:hypothetical protein